MIAPPSRVLHLVAEVIPVTLMVLFAGIVALLALVLDSARRQYALDLADRFTDLAAALKGTARPPRPQISQAAESNGGPPQGLSRGNPKSR
jgi:hypothetical protein